MRLATYRFLTQIIIVVGRLRESVCPRGRFHVIRQDRTFYIPVDGGFVCCDCGLEHASANWPSMKPTMRIRPLRPRRYDYRMRMGGERKAVFVDETGQRGASRG